MPFVYVHGLRGSQETLDDARVKQEAFFIANVNRRNHRQIRYFEARWFHLCRRVDTSSLLGEATPIHLGAEEPVIPNETEYYKRLNSVLSQTNSPDPNDFIDYFILEALSSPHCSSDPEVAAKTIIDLIQYLSTCEPILPFSNWSEISSAANDILIPQEQHRAMDLLTPIQALVLKAKEKIGVKRSGYTEEILRTQLVPAICDFTTDSFSYLLSRDNPSSSPSIKKAVLEQILNVAEPSTSRQPLILLGHSFGGIILYDLLSDESVVKKITAKIGTRQLIFVTVGSQVSLFYQMGFFTFQQSYAPNEITPPKPTTVSDWINVYDRKDALGYSLGPEDDLSKNGIKEFSFDTKCNILEAHGAYLLSELFWSKLGIKLGKLLK